MVSRIDIIGQNGGDGEHYKHVPPPCHSFYPVHMHQRAVNGCLNCVFVSKCVEATRREKVYNK